MNILYIMSFIVEKMSDNIQSQADNLIQYLPLLWDESKDHNMLRCAIISTLVSFAFLFFFLCFLIFVIQRRPKINNRLAS